MKTENMDIHEWVRWYMTEQYHIETSMYVHNLMWGIPVGPHPAQSSHMPNPLEGIICYGSRKQ